ncbi:hypothetical protein [Pantoea sp.]|uniref:hypothetical protein n=1 Tax=Pantoea sp. TaxID=69393 RepID=UPI0028A998DA|nr:hypothetical protein [Pantoea sp.]
MNSTYDVFVKFAAEDRLSRTLNELIKKSRQLEERLNAIPKSLSKSVMMCQRMNDAFSKAGKSSGVFNFLNTLNETNKSLGAATTSAIRFGESLNAVNTSGRMNVANEGVLEYQRLLASTKSELVDVAKLQRQIQKGLKVPSSTIPTPGQVPGASRRGYSGHEDGMSNLMTAYAGFDFLKSSYEKGIEYSRDIARLRQMGLNQAQIDSSLDYVNKTKLPYTSQLDMLRIYTEAQGSFRQSGMKGEDALTAAKSMTPILATYEVAMSALNGDSQSAAAYNMRNLTKTIEILGGAKPGQIALAQKIADSVFKASQSSGRLVDESQLKLFFAHGGSAVTGQNLRSVFGGLEPIIGEMGGAPTSNGMLTAWNRMNGNMSLQPKNLIREMNRLGIADNTGREQNRKLRNLQYTSAIDYAAELMRIYKEHGINSQADREKENAILLGRTGSTIYNRIMAQMDTLEESLKSFDISGSPLQTSNNSLNKQLMAQQALAAKWGNFQLALSKDGGVLDMATTGIDKLTNGLNNLTQWIKDNPNAARDITYTGTALVGLAGTGGAMWLMGTAIKGLAMPFRLLYRPISWLAGKSPEAATGLRGLYTSISSLTAVDGLPLLITRLGMFGGIIGVIGATAFAVYELYKHVKPNEKNQAQWSEASKGASRFNIKNPDALDDYRHLLNPSEYPSPSDLRKSLFAPEVRPYQPNISLEVKNYIDDKEISSHVIKTVVNQASRAPAGVSGVDTTMHLLHPGSASFLYGR